MLRPSADTLEPRGNEVHGQPAGWLTNFSASREKLVADIEHPAHNDALARSHLFAGYALSWVAALARHSGVPRTGVVRTSSGQLRTSLGIAGRSCRAESLVGLDRMFSVGVGSGVFATSDEEPNAHDQNPDERNESEDEQQRRDQPDRDNGTGPREPTGKHSSPKRHHRRGSDQCREIGRASCRERV